jgi:hypothetical protein
MTRAEVETLVTGWWIDLGTPGRSLHVPQITDLADRIEQALRTRDREIATMAESSGIEALRQFAAMLRAEVPKEEESQ